jgi:hypothetical protein
VSEIKTPFCNRSMRPSLDDFALTQHFALAAMGEVSSEATHPSVTIAGMTPEVRVANANFPTADWSFLRCPIRERRRTLRLYERLSCWRCVDLMCRCKQRDNGPRIDRLEKRLDRGVPRARLYRAQPGAEPGPPADVRNSRHRAPRRSTNTKGKRSRPRGNVCLIRLRANP